MAASFVLTLDTTAPNGVTVQINGNATYTNAVAVTLAIATSDTPTTGYEMKVYGDRSGGPATEGAATWEPFSTSKAVTLSAGDGTKTINVKVRDTVGNESSVASDTILVDTTLPIVTIVSGPSATRISKVATFDTVTFGWQSDSVFNAYKVKLSTVDFNENQGTQIPTAGGSTNVAGSAGAYPATTTITTTLKGADVEAAAGGPGNDGAKVVKVFVQDVAQNWSA